MDSQAWFLIGLMGVIAGLSGYFVFDRSNLIGALVVIFTVSWVLFRFSSASRAWDALSQMTNPFMTAVFGFLVGYSYAAFKGFTTTDSLIFAIGAGILGGALGILIHDYWNIGG